MLDATQWINVIGAAALIVVGGYIWLRLRSERKQHAELKRRFGPEYERAVAEAHGSVERAQAELNERERRVYKQPIRALSDADRERFRGDWTQIQARFVDEPAAAVRAAEQLIREVMLAQGYSRESIDRRDTDLAVEHARAIEHLRAARSLTQTDAEGQVDTEQLRQAFVHYRALFADILGAVEPEASNLKQAHA